jgi:hypothetical protein
METPGSSADDLGDTQPWVAPCWEWENAENQMLKGPGFFLLAGVPSRCFQGTGTKSERICAWGGRGRQPQWGKARS